MAPKFKGKPKVHPRLIRFDMISPLHHRAVFIFYWSSLTHAAPGLLVFSSFSEPKRWSPQNSSVSLDSSQTFGWNTLSLPSGSVLTPASQHLKYNPSCSWSSITFYCFHYNFIIIVVVVVQLLSRVWLFASPWTAAHRSLCSSLFPEVCPSSYPLNWWCHATISSSAALFPFCPQSFPESGSFPMSQFFTSGGQRIAVSASASVLPMNIQDLLPLGLTGLISLLPKGLSRVFSSIKN